MGHWIRRFGGSVALWSSVPTRVRSAATCARRAGSARSCSGFKERRRAAVSARPYGFACRRAPACRSMRTRRVGDGRGGGGGVRTNSGRTHLCLCSPPLLHLPRVLRRRRRHRSRLCPPSPLHLPRVLGRVGVEQPELLGVLLLLVDQLGELEGLCSLHGWEAESTQGDIVTAPHGVPL